MALNDLSPHSLPTQSFNGDEDEDDDADDLGDDDNGEDSRAKRRRLEEDGLNKQARRALVQETNRIIMDYYSSCWSGVPSSRIFYGLASDQSKDNNELLW